MEDERELYDADTWRWSREQAEALRRRDLDAIDWKNVIYEIEQLADYERMDWLSYCAVVIERLLLIEHYHASAKKISRWRSKIHRARWDLHTACRDNPSLVAGSRDELLAESWQLGRDAAIGTMARLDTDGGSESMRRDYCERWERCLSAGCAYTFEEIAGLDPERRWREPAHDYYPAGVRRKLEEIFGAELPHPWGG